MSADQGRAGFCRSARAAGRQLSCRAARRSNWPNRPIHVIVPYPAGGIVDMVARAVTEQVGRDLRQTVVVEARPGANSNIGTAAVARSEPDGYTWLVTGPAALVNPGALQGRRLGCDEGFQMRRACGLEPERGARHPVAAGQDHRRIRRTRAQQARPAQFRQSRHRLVDRSVGAKAVPGRRHQAHQCRLQGPAAGADRPDDQPDAFRDRLAGAGAAAHQGRQHQAARGASPTSASPTCPMCRRLRKPDMPRPPMCRGTASMCRQARRTRWSRRSTRPSTRRWKIRMCNASFRSPTFRASRCRWPISPTLMKADHEKLTRW